MNADQAIESPGSIEADRSFKAAVREMWAMGDYHSFAKQTVWEVGAALVEACSIRPGQRVLDVAAGTGNTAIRAARAGAHVVASDLTPENFPAGRAEAARVGVEVEWQVGDAESLPFDDDAFDVVTSSFGAIFAPDHEAVARELTRVCRSGGTVGMATFRPEGVAEEFFELLGRWAPAPPPHARSPLEWGRGDYVRELFGDRIVELATTPRQYVERVAGTPEAYVRLFRETFGPVIAVRGLLASDPDALATFDAEFLAFAEKGGRRTSGATEYTYPYLLVVATVA